MNQKIAIYATDGHISVEIANGASRQTTGRDVRAVIEAMHAADRVTLAQFCTGLLTLLNTTNQKIGA